MVITITVTIEAQNQLYAYNLFNAMIIICGCDWQTMTRSVSRDSLNSQSSFISSLWITFCANTQAYIATAVPKTTITSSHFEDCKNDNKITFRQLGYPTQEYSLSIRDNIQLS